ncbi:MAG TPA: TlpA disulfide reductase family protein [Xanthobacteraceae bacterium]|nr:TlpA disulfide reductase family protein [Xanthobacteraceae bacterium]
MNESRSEARKPRLWRTVFIAALAGAAAGLAAVYGIDALQRNGTPVQADAGCEPAVAAARRLRPLVRGEIAALTLSETPRRVPDLSFRNGDGKPAHLADFRGRTVLLNLWATWCVPCRKEMPALDRLVGRMDGKDFAVVAVNIDTGDPAKPHKFWSDVGIKNLAYYDDPSTGAFQELKRVGRAVGLPTSILVDGAGCEIGYLAGPAEWSSEEAVALVQAALAK